GKEERCFRFGHGPVGFLALSPDGKQFGIPGPGRKLYLYDLTTGKTIYGRAGHTSPVLFATFSGNQRLRSVSGEAACEWEPTTGKALSQRALLATSNWPKLLALAPGGRLL